MSEAEQTQALPVQAGEVRILDAVPAQRAVQRTSLVRVPAVQAAAAVAGGFVAGAAVVGIVGRGRRSRALAKGQDRRALTRRGGGARRRGGSGAGEVLQIVGSRSLLLDVHLLGPSSSG